MAKCYAVESFKSKEKNQVFNVARCVYLSDKTTKNGTYSEIYKVNTFLDDDEYDWLIDKFEPFCDLKLIANIQGDKVFYRLSK